MILRYSIIVDGEPLYDGNCLAAPAVGDWIDIEGTNYVVESRKWLRFGEIYPDGRGVWYRQNESMCDSTLVAVELLCKRA